MTNSLSKWSHLSPLSQQMLNEAATLTEIGHTTQEINLFFDTISCPDIAPFREYLSRYAGLPLSPDRTIGEEPGFLFLRIEKKPRISFNAKRNEWGMLLGETISGAGLNLTESGHFFLATYDGTRLMAAESFDTFIEQCAIIHTAKKQGMIIDGVSTSIRKGAENLAMKHGLKLSPQASDAYGGWWLGKDYGIGTIPLLNRRFEVTAYWPRHNQGLEELWTNELISLMEPHKRRPKKTEIYKKYRDSKDDENLFAELVEYCETNNLTRPAESFRIAVQQGLTSLAEEGRASKLPEHESDLYEYLKKEIKLAEKNSDSLAIYFCALGLLAYGEIDAFPIVLDHLPLNEDTEWGKPLWGGAFLHDLFPGQFDFDPIDEMPRVRELYNRIRHSNVWNEKEGIYEHA